MELTPSNIRDHFARIGLTLEHELQCQGWERFFIHLLEEGNSIPLSLGRINFHHGILYGITWYAQPRYGGKIWDHNYWQFKWALYYATGKTLTLKQFNRLCKKANTIAHERYHEKVQARKLLPKKKRRALAPPNQWGAAWRLIQDWLTQRKEIQCP